MEYNKESFAGNYLEDVLSDAAEWLEANPDITVDNVVMENVIEDWGIAIYYTKEGTNK